MHVLADLVAESGTDLDQLHAAAGGIVLQFLERARDVFVRRRGLVVEQRGELGDRERLSRAEQRGFENSFDLGDFWHRSHHSPAVASDLR